MLDAITSYFPNRVTDFCFPPFSAENKKENRNSASSAVIKRNHLPTLTGGI
jgi:hypothetical protein